MKKIKDGNFKVKCLNNGDDTGLTVGKIYEFKDGYSQWDDGEKLPQFKCEGINRFSNFEDLRKWFGSLEEDYDEDDEYAYKFELISEELENSDSELDYTKSPSIHIYPNKKNPAQTIALLKFGNEITDRVVSRCHPDDYYDFKKGAEVAFNRLFNLDVDNKSCELNNANIINNNSNGNNSNNKVKKVKRLAQPGEYVIITNASIYDPYKNGDILKITDSKNYSFGLTARYGDSNGQFLYDNEYLVLENYDPKLILDYSYDKGNLSQFSDNELIEELKKRLNK